MGPSQRAESSREAETDNGITADANDSTVLLLVITLTFGCDETPQQFGSITHTRTHAFNSGCSGPELVESSPHKAAILPGFLSSWVEIRLLRGEGFTDFHSVQIRKPGWDYGLGSEVPALDRISWWPKNHQKQV